VPRKFSQSAFGFTRVLAGAALILSSLVVCSLGVLEADELPELVLTRSRSTDEPRSSFPAVGVELMGASFG